MRFNLTLNIIAGLVVSGLYAGAAYADEMYQTGSDGTVLYKTDTTNGSSTAIGPFGYSNVYGNAFSPNGQMYVITDSGSPASTLATVNLTTGTATPVGAPTGVRALMGIAFAPNGTLYGASWANNNLYTLNTTTGAASLVGNLGVPGFVMDLSYDYANSTMYGISSSGPQGSLLYSVDLGTGAGTLVTNISGNACLMGLSTTSSGKFITTDYCSLNSPLYQINPQTGDLTNLGSMGISRPMGGDIFQVASVPEPTSYALLLAGLGLTGLMIRRKSKK